MFGERTVEGVVGYIDDWSFSRVQAEPHNHTPCENKWEAARSEVMAAESSDKQR